MQMSDVHNMLFYVCNSLQFHIYNGFKFERKSKSGSTGVILFTPMYFAFFCMKFDNEREAFSSVFTQWTSPFCLIIETKLN